MNKLKKIVKIGHSHGIHIRVATEIVKASQQFVSDVRLYQSVNPDVGVNAKAILDLMTAGIECGEEVAVICEGADAEKAMEVMVYVLSSNFD